MTLDFSCSITSNCQLSNTQIVGLLLIARYYIVITGPAFISDVTLEGSWRDTDLPFTNLNVNNKEEEFALSRNLL